MADMLTELDRLLRSDLMDLLDAPEMWDSLVINRRKPTTYRVFTTLENGNRVSLHRFDPCGTEESFRHPHPWPGAFMILDGAYAMQTWLSRDREDTCPVQVADLVLRTMSGYEIDNPLTWHAITPLETTWTVMLNGPPFPPEVAHVSVRRTGGKDLDKMPEHELLIHLEEFRARVAYYGAM